LQPTVPSRTAGEGKDRKSAGGFPQVGDKLWTIPCPDRGHSSMEGTSGAADRGPLRGGSGEAALGPGWCPRKRPIRAGGSRASGFPRPGSLAQAGCLGAVASIAKAGSRGGLVRGTVNPRFPRGLRPRRHRPSSRRRHELTTRGVRADRVGAKLSPRGIAARGAGGESRPAPGP
jgi:hypothetical protein